MITNKIFIFIFLIGLLGSSANAGVFSKRQMGEISCAATKTQLFYYYLAPNRDSNLSEYKMKCNGRDLNIFMPKWFEEESKSMLAKKVWRDPEEGEISEAAMWQTSVSIIYEFLNLVKKLFRRNLTARAFNPLCL